MWTIMIGSVDGDTELVEVMVANPNRAWGTYLAESDPLYAELLNAADQVINRANGVHSADAGGFVGRVLEVDQ